MASSGEFEETTPIHPLINIGEDRVRWRILDEVLDKIADLNVCQVARYRKAKAGAGNLDMRYRLCQQRAAPADEADSAAWHRVRRMSRRRSKR